LKNKRAKRGWRRSKGTMRSVGAWELRASSGSGEGADWRVRVLGRRGVMSGVGGGR